MAKLLAVKLRNRLKKKAGNASGKMVVKLENVRQGGQNVGCSGFVGNLESGELVYVNTSMSGVGGSTSYLFRTVKDLQDYTGDTNRFASNQEQLVNAVLALTNLKTA